MGLDLAWREALADLAINLSAGWFGAIVIISPFVLPLGSIDVILLFIDAAFGMVFLVTSVKLRRSV